MAMQLALGWRLDLASGLGPGWQSGLELLSARESVSPWALASEWV